MKYYYKYKKYKLKYLKLKQSMKLIGGNKITNFDNKLSFGSMKSDLLGFDHLSYNLF